MAERMRTGIPAALAVLAVLAVTPSTPAAAAENAPPEPGDDVVTIYAGGTRGLAVLANDTDPDGDELTVCRIGEATRGLAARQPYAPPGAPPGFGEPGDVVVTAGPRTAGRELSVVYYACDGDRLAPATVTVEVLEATPVAVRALPRRPGVFVVRNTQDFRVDFSFDYRKGGTFAGTFTSLRPDERNRFRVPADRVVWRATNNEVGYADRGSLRNLR